MVFLRDRERSVLKVREHRKRAEAHLQTRMG